VANRLASRGGEAAAAAEEVEEEPEAEEGLTP
jgi:hypothetical protein